LDNVLSFSNTNARATTNNLGTFQLNRLTMTNGSSASNAQTLSIAGNTLNFVKNSSDVSPTLVLSRTNSANVGQTPRITISASITVTDALTITTTVASGQVLLSGNIANNAGMTFNGTSAVGVTVGNNASPFGAVSGAGGITVNGSYNVNLVGNNTYTGLTDVQSGTLTLNRSGGTIANASAVRVSGGTLNVAQADTVGAVTLSSGTISGAAVLTGSSYSLTNTGTVSAVLGGTSIALSKSGAGTATLSAVNTYTGATTVSEGVLNLGVANAVSASSNVVLSGGELESAFSQSLGTLNLTGISTLDLSTGGSFVFADSSALDSSWTGTLSIIGTFTDGLSVRFGTSSAGLTAGQLGQITINGLEADIDLNGYLVVAAIPEPSTYAVLVGATTLGLAAWRRRRAI
jgi:autotransporter-associated beta strand protein